MFYGLSALLADLVIVLAPVLILGVEVPRFRAWLDRRRLDPILNPAVAQAAALSAPRVVEAAGLVDPESTERIRVSEWLRGEQAEQPASPVTEKAPCESGVLVGGGAGESRVSPSIRLPRS